ncbi:MAG: LacI family DNA-binding transcriptional regulator, partial [Pacificimonas sp.]
ADVSFKTVSRVLNGEAYEREAPRDRVLTAARSLNYQFNHAARSLRSGAAQIVALVVDNPSRAYMESVHLGALQQCQKAGLHVVMEGGHVGERDGTDIDLDALEASIVETAPMGAVITPPLCDNPDVIAMLERRNIRYVLIAPGQPARAPASVNMDDRAAAREMTAHLIGLGHRRIGFIKGHPDHSATDIRYSGYLAALAEADITPDDDLVTQGMFDWQSGLACADRLLALAERPTAIFASNDDMAAAVIAAAYRRDLHVPRDLSVTGFDDTPVAGVISPQLTTIYQPIVEMVSEAVRILTDPVAGAGGEATRITLPYRLVRRSSTGRVA